MSGACRPGGRHAYSLSSRAGSGAQGAFQFLLGPLDHVVELLLALRELGDHDGVDRLVVDLRADLRACRSAQNRGLLVAARWISIDGARRRSDLVPGLEVVHRLE